MTKHRTRVKLSKTQKLENEVSRWTAKKEAAIAMLIKSSATLKQLDRAQRRLRKANQAELARVTEEHHAKSQLPPMLSESCDAIVSGMLQGQSFEEASKDDGIPPFLKREARPFNPYEAEQKAAKAEKAKVRIAKMKAAQTVKNAELTGKRRKMPLTGKAALNAIADRK
jgi:hypothetical protein